MLNQEAVDAEEEAIRQRVRELSDEQRMEYFRRFNKVVKDPDTYAGPGHLHIRYYPIIHAIFYCRHCPYHWNIAD